jgi:uncharacterized membrane protein HdeD (DUF308 family)
MAVQNFCTFCGEPRTDMRAGFCGKCGRSFAVGPQPAVGTATLGGPASLVGAFAPAGALANARKRPLWIVFLLTAGTLSIYFFVHLGLMWSEMKRARSDPSMNPVGHVFAQFVPIYGWFRFHAHVRTLNEMLEESGSAQRVAAGWATAVYIGISAFAVIAGSEATPDWLILPAYAAYGGFAAWRQQALNAYYDQVSQGTIPERVRGFEWVVLVLGCLLLILVVLGLALPTP